MVQYRFCCHEWCWCDKDCDNCTLFTPELKLEQREQRERDRRSYKTWAALIGEKIEGDD